MRKKNNMMQRAYIVLIVNRILFVIGMSGAWLTGQVFYFYREGMTYTLFLQIEFLDLRKKIMPECVIKL